MMGTDLANHCEASKQVFQEASDATGVDVLELVSGSDEDTLRQTQNAQLALFTAGVAAWRALQMELPGLQPGAAAGHSVGEYAALAAAQVFSVGAGAKLVRKRGELMAASGSVRPGTMAALVGVDRESAEKLCQEARAKGECVVANDNCPGQLVISGDLEAVQHATANAADFGAKRAIPLNVSGAFHSPLMKESAEKLGEALAATEFSEPKFPIFSNVLTTPGEDWPDLLQKQLESPVLWADSMRNLNAEGADTFVECGSGEVLCGLMRRIDRSKKCYKVVDMATLENTVNELRENIG